MRGVLIKNLPFVMIAALMMALLGCSSSSDPGDGGDPPGDTTAPTVTSAVATAVDRVEVTFNETVDKATAEDPANYLLVETAPSVVSGSKSWRKPTPAGPGDEISVTGASLRANGKTVDLVTNEMDAFAPYKVVVAGVADSKGNIVTTDEKPIESQIKSGRIFTIAGNGIPALGSEDIDPLQSSLYLPQDMTLGPDGLLYVLDWNNHRIRVIENGLIRTVLGTGLLGDAQPGNALEVGLNHPTQLAFGPDGKMYLAAWHNSKVLVMDMTTRMVDVVVGQLGARAYGGDGGPALDAHVNLPCAVDFDDQGRMYIADQANWRIRRVLGDGTIETWAGVGTRGFCGDGGPASQACFSAPSGQAAAPSSRLEFDHMGNLYVADTSNQRVRKIDTNGIITTIAGAGVSGYAGDGGVATSALLHFPADVAINSKGECYIADKDNHCIRKVDSNGVIWTVAGKGDVIGYSGDGGPATEATMKEPFGICFDPDDNLYISDTKNHVIRVVYK